MVLLSVEAISYNPNRDRELLRRFINGDVDWKLGIISYLNHVDQLKNMEFCEFAPLQWTMSQRVAF